MADKKHTRAIGYVDNGSTGHVLYEGGKKSWEVPIGHILELIADGVVPFKRLDANGKEIAK